MKISRRELSIDVVINSLILKKYNYALILFERFEEIIFAVGAILAQYWRISADIGIQYWSDIEMITPGIIGPILG